MNACPLPRRLLVLDDEADIGLTICMIAESIGFESRFTTSAAEFFAIQQAWDPTHVALDLIMPQVDGIEVIRELAGRGCRAEVVITSGAGERILEAAHRASDEHGLNVLGSIAKPFTPARLRALLQQERPRRGRGASAEAPAPSDEVTGDELRAAIAARQFTIALQPKIACADGALAGFEALVRWRHPERGLIMPVAFIPLAESTGLIGDITTQVLDMALTWLGQTRPAADLLVSVNLSARSLGDIELANEVHELCEARGVAPGRVILEVTETWAMADPLTTLDLLTRLRLKGFQLSIDDFGVGYSSLVQLARLPFSELKIDTSFVRDMVRSGESRKIVNGIIGLGHSLGLRVTAEGVEEGAALDLLREARCDLAQGYFIGRPMSREDALIWMAARGA